MGKRTLCFYSKLVRLKVKKLKEVEKERYCFYSKLVRLKDCAR